MRIAIFDTWVGSCWPHFCRKTYCGSEMMLKRNELQFVVLVWICMALACGSDPTSSAGDEGWNTLDQGTDGLLVPDAQLDQAETTAPCEPVFSDPEPGTFGAPCTSNADCADPFCLPSRFGSICSQSCITDCPEGFICKGIDLGSGDLTFLCVDRMETLCMPCKDSADCQAQYGGESAICLPGGEDGSFCGADCSDVPCPCGYTCSDYVAPNGLNYKQCVPDGGQCGCSQRAVELQATTECETSSQFGTCSGERYCTVSGLTNCDASFPDQETCDGIDNNCDGITDNLEAGGITCPITNDIGTCPGTPVCEDGEVLCLGEEATEEICNGLDDDCNGVTDDPFPNSDDDTMPDCIDDDDDNDGVIDPDDNCQLDPNPLQENNDGDEMGDACDPDDDNDTIFDEDDCAPFDGQVYPGNPETCDGKDNNCNGQIDEGICDDGNYCTQDLCDSGGGCTNNPRPDGTPCDDGTVCTQIDICQGGQCQGGNELNCDDGNQCTTDECNPVTGCSSINNSASCSDMNECTLNDSCLNGACLPGPTDSCNDSNVCTADSCNPATGCVNQAIGGGCSTGISQCDTGNCLGGSCVPVTGTACNDGDSCTDFDQCTTNGCSGQEKNCDVTCQQQCSGIYLGGAFCVFGGCVCAGTCINF
ncbi:MAG: hypothetical protein CMH54_02380 [Myxococcales bacterium]|nr:hypothetical protein [Myxococcales bacterium]